MTAELFSSFGVPATVILDGDGIIRGLWLGYRSRYGAQMEALIAELLADQEPRK